MTDTKLATFRTQIDAIDDDLIALLKRRSAIVKKVGEHKTNLPEQHCFIRPGREACMIRDIMQKDAGAFPPHYLAAIWRLLIAGSTNIEQTITAAVWDTPHHPELYWLAREYFGATTPITRNGHPLRVISEVAEQRAMVGFLPVPQEEHKERITRNDVGHDWWLMLAEQRLNWPHIFALAPLVDDPYVPPAWIVGDVLPEETGDDTTVMVIEAKEALSRDRIATAFSKANSTGQRLAEAAVAGSNNHIAYLCNVAGFCRPEGKTVSIVKADLGECVTRVAILGCYANPVPAIMKEK